VCISPKKRERKRKRWKERDGKRKVVRGVRI